MSELAMPAVPPSIDAVFRALADPTRRRVVEQLAHGPRSVTALAEPYDMKLPSFVRHVKVLEEAGLVRTNKVGRVRTCRLAGESLRPVEGWLNDQRRLWERRLDQFDEYLLEMNRDPKENDQ